MKNQFIRLLCLIALSASAVVWAQVAPSVDFGDTPPPYPTTLKENGARHTIVQGIHLGTLIDGEVDGQGNASATGDNITGLNDDDGVTFLSLISPGQTAKINVVASSTGLLNAWLDFNADGDWLDAGEQIFTDKALVAGDNALTFTVPADIKPGSTFARFRFSTVKGLSFTGLASNGEVEDYLVNIAAPQDFGDAPAPYPTLLSANGARHVISNTFFLGKRIDGEIDGQPDPAAKGDDSNPATNGSDEDGVVFTSSLVPGQIATIDVTCTMATTETGRLNAWVDFNSNGTWADTGEQILADAAVVAGVNSLKFTVPASAVGGNTFARFRLNRQGKLGFTGAAQDGEVEDYQVAIAAQMDFGDAPSPYPTLLKDDGARHTLDQKYYLGRLIDVESDGQPNSTATGDDISPAGAGNDEDGVVFLTPLIPGQTATVAVTTPSSRGFLNAWIDFNGNGSWADKGDQICTALLLNAGTSNIVFNVPIDSKVGTTYARFRFSTVGQLSFTGAAPNGEVEDYQVTVGGLMDFGDAPRPYPTVLKDDGARHTFDQKYLLGRLIDVEPDGQPNSTATGDDASPAGAGDDEDGVVFLTPLIPGQTATVAVTTPSERGFLNAWVDFNGNGSWADKGDQICTALLLTAGTSNIVFNVPADANGGATYARFRFSTQPELSFTGPAPNGEVEDYMVRIRPNRERCDLTCEGRNFWLTFPGNYAPDPDNPVKLSLSINGNPGTLGIVDIPGIAFTTNFTVAASGTVTVVLPSAADLGEVNDAITNRGVRVRSSADISITAFNHVHYTTDSYLALHNDVLGQEYVVLGFGNVFTGIPPLNGSQFAIIGTVTNSKVTITPSVKTMGHPAGIPFNIVLQPGECYQLRNTNDAPSDLSGTIITSDQPIGVFGSHQCASVPTSTKLFCDYLVEQLLPVNTWGNNFFTVPLATRSGDTFRCLAAYDGTTVSINGVPFATLNRGEFQQFPLVSAAQISADHPIFMAQYANSSDADGVVNADPFMLTLQATRHWVNGYRVSVPTNDFATNYLNVVALTAAAGSISIDGIPIAAAAYTPIAGSAFSYARPLVTPGSHTVTGGSLFGLSVYGWSEYESYGHPACFHFGDVLPPTITPSVSSVTVSVIADSNTPGYASTPNIAANSTAQDLCDQETRTPTQTPKPGTLVAPGLHTISVFATDSSGNIGKADVAFTVLDPSPVIITCPRDIVTDCNGTDGAIVEFNVSARSTYDTNVTVVSVPASGSLFPPGTTTVISTATSLAGKTDTCSFKVIVNCQGSIRAVQSADGLTLFWTGASGVLEHASTTAGPWEGLTTDVNQYRVHPGLFQEYFRVRY
jgi:hypothetical protein